MRNGSGNLGSLGYPLGVAVNKDILFLYMGSDVHDLTVEQGHKYRFTYVYDYVTQYLTGLAWDVTEGEELLFCNTSTQSGFAPGGGYKIEAVEGFDGWLYSFRSYEISKEAYDELPWNEGLVHFDYTKHDTWTNKGDLRWAAEFGGQWNPVTLNDTSSVTAMEIKRDREGYFNKERQAVSTGRIEWNLGLVIPEGSGMDVQGVFNAEGGEGSTFLSLANFQNGTIYFGPAAAMNAAGSYSTGERYRLELVFEMDTGLYTASVKNLEDEVIAGTTKNLPAGAIERIKLVPPVAEPFPYVTELQLKMPPSETAPVLAILCEDSLQPMVGGSMTVTVSCEDTPERVELYEGAIMVGSDSTSDDGFQFELNNLQEGVCRMTALAIYSDGSVRKSKTEEVAVCAWNQTAVANGSKDVTLTSGTQDNLYGVTRPDDIFLMDITYQTNSATSYSNIQPWDQPASGGSNATVLTVQDGAFKLLGEDIAASCDAGVPYRIQLLIDRTTGTMKAEIRNANTNEQLYYAAGLAVPAAVQNLQRVKIEEISADSAISTQIGLDIYNLTDEWSDVVIQTVKLIEKDAGNREILRLSDITADPSGANWNVSIQNSTAADVSGMAMLAVYDADGILLGCSMTDETLTLSQGSVTEASIEMPAVSGVDLEDAEIRVFLLEGIETIRPLSQSRSI